MITMQKAKTIADETAALHTAYYTIGTSSKLKETKIIDRKGGLLGIGKTSKIAANVDNDKFNRIDYTMVNYLPLNSKNVKIITNHPSDSYLLYSDGSNKRFIKNLLITNPEKFWSVSKYLVIQRD